MSILELSQKYGRQKGRQVVNAAIRAELPCGNEILDGLKKYGDIFLAAQNEQNGYTETEKRLAGQIFYDLQRFRDILGDAIARRYGLKTKFDEQPQPDGN